MENIASRNRRIKMILSQAFGKGKVTVRGSRGTAYGWIDVRIEYAPKNLAERNELTRMIWQLFDKAQIEIGTYGYDDAGSDYGYGRKMHLDFLPLIEKSADWL